MLDQSQKVAIYMEASLNSDYGKMGFGVMRYIANPIVCVIDSTQAGKTVQEITNQPFAYPVVDSVAKALEMGAQVLVLGTAPSGGRVPESWHAPLDEAIVGGMNIVNGLHDKLNVQFGELLGPNQWIWDVRQPAFTPKIASAKAAELNNKRVLLVGTDMAIGKMTAGLEVYRFMKEQGVDTRFLATGQIGITVTGQGIPLDAFKVDHACGAVETMVMENGKSDVLFIEGQGSLLHPGSSATLSLMRGSCATHLIMCHRAEMTHLRHPITVKVPPINEFIALNEALTSVCGSLTQAKTVGIALNTAKLDDEGAKRAIANLEDETGLPVQDVVRYGAEKLANTLI